MLNQLNWWFGFFSFSFFPRWSTFLQEYCKMNFLGNLFLHLKNFDILGPQQMGGMILTNSSEQLVCFMTLLEYDFFVLLLLQMNFYLCVYLISASQHLLLDILNAVSNLSATGSLPHRTVSYF